MNEPLNSMASNNTVRIAVIGVLMILALFLLAETIAVAQGLAHPTTPAANTITVTGTGQAALAPDVATITYSVITTGTSVSDAQSAATTQSNTALAAVKKFNIADTDIRTVSYDVTPQYEKGSTCPPGLMCPDIIQSGSRNIVGYQVSETIEVKIHNLDQTGDILQALGDAGVQDVNGPDLGLDNPNEGTDAARADAINNAKQEAAILANQLGVHLGRITSFSEGGGVYPMAYGAANAMTNAAAPAAPDIPTGTNTYSANVTITYEID